MITSIKFDRIRFHAYHGVMEQERRVGNDFEVTIVVRYPFAEAMENDDLSSTLNYALLYEAVAEVMAVPSKLLEHVAGRIISRLRSDFPLIEGGSVTVAKLTPPIKGQMASVSVTVDF